MENKLQEILTVEIYYKKDRYEIWVPVQNLIDPKFLLKNDDLFVLLNKYERGYVIKNIPKQVLSEIEKEKVLLVESIHDKRKKHIIKLYP